MPPSPAASAAPSAATRSPCAAAIAVFERIEQDGLLAEADRIEAALRPALLDLQSQYPIIAEVRGIGAMLAIELVDPETGSEPLADVPGKIAAFAAQQRRAGAHRRNLRQRAALPAEPRDQRRADRGRRVGARRGASRRCDLIPDGEDDLAAGVAARDETVGLSAPRRAGIARRPER